MNERSERWLLVVATVMVMILMALLFGPKLACGQATVIRGYNEIETTEQFALEANRRILEPMLRRTWKPLSDEKGTPE
jgi:uncharacterized membrane protein